MRMLIALMLTVGLASPAFAGSYRHNAMPEEESAQPHANRSAYEQMMMSIQPDYQTVETPWQPRRVEEDDGIYAAPVDSYYYGVEEQEQPASPPNRAAYQEMLDAHSGATTHEQAAPTINSGYILQERDVQEVEVDTRTPFRRAVFGR